MKKVCVAVIFTFLFCNLGYSEPQEKNVILDKQGMCNRMLGGLDANGKKEIVEKFIDYIYYKPGVTVTYKIEIGEVSPIFYEVVEFSGGSRRTLSQYKYKPGAKKDLFLKLKVKGVKSYWNMDGNGFGTAFSVVQDDLQLYNNVKEILWCPEVAIWQKDNSQHIFYHEILVYGNGYSKKLIMHGKLPQDDNNLDNWYQDFSDGLRLVGNESSLGPKIPGLHFCKSVNFSESISSDFEEHTYFVKGKGLVFLEQRVEGKTSMIWRLVDSDKK